ncbi:MAG: type II toxin-antitoxin system VapC family toxin [Pelobium sp.]
MALLLDIQVMIWLEENPSKIAESTRNLIFKEKEVYYSHVSVWEMAIKIKTEKLFLNQTLETFIRNFQSDYHFLPLPISANHIYKTQELDFYHKDPFDRLLIAQSLIENIPLVSSDSIFDSYLKNRIW